MPRVNYVRSLLATSQHDAPLLALFFLSFFFFKPSAHTYVRFLEAW